MKGYVPASHGNTRIGIWWYTDDGQVWSQSDFTANGYQDGYFLQYSVKENHETLWSSTVMRNASDDANKIISRGYKSLERGRVIYNCATACFEVPCSEAIYYDKDFRDAIINHFNLQDCEVHFLKNGYYYKIELTGEEMLDKFY